MYATLERPVAERPVKIPGPDHRIDIAPNPHRVVVWVDGRVIADTRDALTLREQHFGTVHYIPRKDVKMDRLARTSHSTHCPFKGDASYFSLKGGPENAAWSYETPYDEMTAIKGYLAFYPNKVTIEAE